MSSALIEAQKISYHGAEGGAIDEVSLSIASGDFTTIIGPNGAGKSTLLRLLMGLLKPTKGARVVSPLLKFGYVPQHLGRLNEGLSLSAKAFLNLCLKPDVSLQQEVFDLLQVSPFLNQSMQALSGGQRQKIYLARALLQKPNVLVMDEPIQSLDLASQDQFYRLLEKVYQTHDLAVLMVSHDLHYVMACSQHVVCLYGHVCCQGKPESFKDHPMFQSPPDLASLKPYTHHHTHTHG